LLVVDWDDYRKQQTAGMIKGPRKERRTTTTTTSGAGGPASANSPFCRLARLA
jgi:hypothetical protein